MTALLIASACGGTPTPSALPPPAPEIFSEPAAESTALEATDFEAAAKSVEEAMNANKDALHRCWEKAAADDYRLSGDLRLAVTMAAGGKVSQVIVTSDEPLDGVLTSCVTTLVRGFTLSGFPDDSSLELPFRFAGVDVQYAVRAEDAPVHPLKANITAKVLLDAASVDAKQASMSILTLPAGQAVPWHKHTASAELVFVLDGAGRFSPKGELVTAGGAGYVRAGVAHGFWNTEKTPAKLLVVYASPGPEQRFLGKREPSTGPAQPGRKKARVKNGKQAKELSFAHGLGHVRILFDKKSAVDGAAYIGVITLDAGLALPEHAHEKEAELLYVTQGTGVMTIGGDEIAVFPGLAIHIPANTKHAFRVTSKESVRAVHVYAPSGPEQRFKKAIR